VLVGSGVDGLYEVATWLVYAVAAVMMLAVIAAAVLFGLALRFVARLLRELGDGREKDHTQHAEDGPRSPA
jgi:hypothetical protein